MNYLKRDIYKIQFIRVTIVTAIINLCLLYQSNVDLSYLLYDKNFNELILLSHQTNLVET